MEVLSINEVCLALSVLCIVCVLTLFFLVSVGCLHGERGPARG